MRSEMMNPVPKPIDSTWTDDQWKAIVTEGKDTLIAAAAGSGKTAVLVERIIRKVTSPNQPTDVDRLLIVTFTNAAAAEMKNRIGEALEKALANHPASQHLRKQLSLLNRASISTLHSFCMDVLKRYYYKIDIDPSFRILDQTEGELLREEVLDDLFEEQYSIENNDPFFDVVDRFSNDRNDLELQVLVKKLYDFSRSHPNPAKWLEEIKSDYQLKETTILEDLPWYKPIIQDILMNLLGSKELLQYALNITREPSGPAPYAENLEDDIKQIDKLIENLDEWDKLHESINHFKLGRLKSCRGDEFDKTLQEQVKNLRDKVKKNINNLQEELFSRSGKSFLTDLRELEPVMDVLINLVKQFAKRFQGLKQEKGVVDFADLEHFCLEVLKAEGTEPEEFIRSEAAFDYQGQFDEILVDEYQDTNHVQETILRLIARPKENLFMVGDVKQSIYRFRLAEPGLFLAKYKQFAGDKDGIRIDLAKNFRSRKEVLDGTNFLFKQLMNETIGEIEYDKQAELKLGSEYSNEDHCHAELAIIDRNTEEQDGDDTETLAEVESAQLEARFIAQKIREIIGYGEHPPLQVFDKKLNGNRNVTYRDIVILMRSMPWAPVFLEELKKIGIPAYAELSSGYFEAIEVTIMMSLLKTIDNPLQDIPLAAVLRSPIVGLTEDDLAHIRLHHKKGDFYDALCIYLDKGAIVGDEQVYLKLHDFHEKLEGWRTRARQGSLSELIWQIFRETGYYDFVGGLSGGKQRQANLRALYDRARQYESTSFRGLFRFLRFIERMQERGDDLGTARALGEQEDVVRLMTIHKSKGLEFPVVFIGGLQKEFNQMDLRAKVLLHKELGLGTKLVNPRLRISYPTFPQLAIKRQMRQELIAEELRVLYVALTRAREKLYLVGTLKKAEKTIQEWQRHLGQKDWLLPDFDRYQAKSYLDWIGPALVRHQDCSPLRIVGSQEVSSEIWSYPAKWKIELIHGLELQKEESEAQDAREEILHKVRKWEKVEQESQWSEKVVQQLSFRYSYKDAVKRRSKQSVTEMKRQKETIDDFTDQQFLRPFKHPITDRPKFLQKQELTPAEKGTAMHMVMQHVNLAEDISSESIKAQLEKMVHMELLSHEQAEQVRTEEILALFESELGEKIRDADTVYREVPFSLGIPAKQAYPDWNSDIDETVLIQGVIDCLLVNGDDLTLIDYKTDRITSLYKEGFTEAAPILRERYQFQLDLYGKAIERIINKQLKDKFLYFFDGGHVLKI